MTFYGEKPLLTWGNSLESLDHSVNEALHQQNEAGLGTF